MNIGITQNLKPHPTAGRKGCFMPVSSVDCSLKPIDKLFYPKEIADEIGMSKQRISFLRHKGCRFYGRKTTIRWVRDYLNDSTLGVATFLPPSQHQQN
jgi:hypothetical protein